MMIIKNILNAISEKPKKNDLNNRWREVDINKDLKKMINNEKIYNLRKLHGYV